jgi:hypothetical protein
MNRTRYMLVALLLVCFGALPGVSMALPQFARAVIYFDANDNIIGNSNLYCNNVREHAGTVDYGNANRVEFEFGCGDPIVSCDSLGVCSTVGHNTVVTPVYFRSATGRTIDNYCLDPTYLGGPFFNKKGCELPAPSELSGLGNYTSGLGY